MAKLWRDRFTNHSIWFASSAYGALESPVESLLSEITKMPSQSRFGRVSGVQGLLIEAAGIDHVSSVGARVRIVARDGGDVPAEVVGYRNGHALLMPFKSLEGIGIGSKAYVAEEDPFVYPSNGWLGRVVNAMGDPIDGKGPLPARAGRLFPARRSRRWRIRAAGWARSSISASGPSTPSSPPARASAWASSPARASASRS